MLIANKNALDLKFITSIGEIILTGRNNSVLKNPHYGQTEITEAQWEVLQKEYGHSPDLKFQNVFVAKNPRELDAKAEDLKEIKTGDEGVKENKKKLKVI